MVALIDMDIIAYRYAHVRNNETSSGLVSIEERFKTDVQRFLRTLKEDTGATHYIGYLTGKDNFRKHVSVTRVYKGNRSVKEKPRYLSVIWKVLVEEFGCFFIQGMEADDGMSIDQQRLTGNENFEASIICTTDKDLDQVPGKHYNWTKRSIYTVTHDEGLKSLYVQALCGDSTDNIEGIPGVGPKTAEKMLEGVPVAKQHMIVLNEYVKRLPLGVAVHRFYEMFTLVKMLGPESRHVTPEPIEFGRLGR